MKPVIVTTALVALATLATACQISPVITDPGSGSGDRYADCRRASRAYCEDVRGHDDGGALRKCVAKATYECVSGHQK